VASEGSVIRRRRLWAHPAAVIAYRFVRRAAERAGLQVLLKTYYSPIPDLRLLPEDMFERRDALHGIAFDVERQAEFVERELGEAATAFPADGDVPSGYRFDPGNASFPEPDARVLFAMVRHLRPQRVVELGSGQTSRVIAAGLRRNAEVGAPTEYRAYDPFPTAVDGGLPGLTELVEQKAQDVPDAVFAALREGDVLFVDTTHTVKLGSDVNRIVLGVLPLLAPGVVVHFHDICLPYEYPRYLMDDYGLYWAEQYLLQAFLSCNPSFEVLCGVHALVREQPERMAAAGIAAPGQSGSSIWLRRTK
jgi:hypothetical protein